MSNLYDLVNREFWTLLRSMGFPREIDDAAIQREALRIEEKAENKRLMLRSWSMVEGGRHSEDVALVKLLADSLGLVQGRDWDWELEEDRYHFSIAYSRDPRVERLIRLADLFNRAQLVRIDFFGRVSPSEAEKLSQEEIQRMLHESWKRWGLI